MRVHDPVSIQSAAHGLLTSTYLGLVVVVVPTVIVSIRSPRYKRDIYLTFFNLMGGPPSLQRLVTRSCMNLISQFFSLGRPDIVPEERTFTPDAHHDCA
jgi:hypothetical protein